MSKWQPIEIAPKNGTLLKIRRQRYERMRDRRTPWLLRDLEKRARALLGDKP